MDLKKAIQTKFDLHMHTTASDGEYSPTEIVKKAYKCGLETIAITDHDTLAGITEAKKAAEKYRMNVISAVELSTKYDGVSVDVLGYNIRPTEALEETLVQLREGRVDRAKRIIKKFNEIGFSISMEDVLEFSENGVIARPHIAKVVVKKGYVKDYQTVFDDYLADGKPCALPKKVLTPEQGIELIHQAGGSAVLAHPVYLDIDVVKELLRFSFDGIEVWHRNHLAEHRQLFKQLAKEFRLLMTGGSDFHTDEHKLGEFGFSEDEIH
ncbi:PHP domain-containing protein [Halalkalibacter hemicellulosilyticus]|uniref:Metal-dependent phosphoesterases n=1 Tax=Halalkalibacter hemicellulosilyticusJCM 9152 TaxID=1236971 RepID=W4QI01_9BACI|nr:PHP domain-containing protein [Halalkalibacter hemicellulosilyticus]GAE30934.1 metal-dependent phosphoesterases [Halalkalibacter hemicellulosilyticusJCM 9152]